MNEKKVKDNLDKLHVQRSFWKANGTNALCWAFYCASDNKKVNITTPQTMCYIICHNNPVLNLNPKTQARKGSIIYNTMNGIVTLKKHINSNLFFLIIFFEDKVNYLLREEEKQPSKKRLNISSNSTFIYFLQKNLSRKRMCNKNNF
jgi:hypothetical protein